MALDALEGLVEDRYGKVSPNFLKLSLLKAPESLPVVHSNLQSASQESERTGYFPGFSEGDECLLLARHDPVGSA